MTNEQKIIKNKLGLLRLEKQLGNVSQARLTNKKLQFPHGDHLPIRIDH
jgi:hypothetical protein